ncbi:hypothetical protein LEM8419_03224 [Neolewinella maritima]|uniref:Uncharacterized protein n=1 Tax=Neolewinella maritima TaxID=1383882 RepID=A0ABN8FAK5_9BACT|nr:hypothetical protein [Neolewinella maritima]CAH1002312.1 hypothetical protein LEM8419_03224 [Neolewinella maritima]
MLIRLLCCCFLTGALSAQPLLDTLAVKVCDCMHATPELVYPRLQANRCVLTISTAYASRIRAELQLSPRKASDRRRLGELLVEPLTADCPLLRALAPGTLEPELHYSDFPLLKKARLPKVDKEPPASPAATTTREVPTLLRASGTLTQLPNGDRLRVLLAEGSTQTFTLPRAIARRLTLTRGQPITVVYREDWRTDGYHIKLTVVRIE